MCEYRPLVEQSDLGERVEAIPPQGSSGDDAKGKIVITGGKDPGDAHQALDAVREELDALGLLG
jgi:hypothetical protein